MRVGDLLSERFFVICDDGREGEQDGGGEMRIRTKVEVYCSIFI